MWCRIRLDRFPSNRRSPILLPSAVSMRCWHSASSARIRNMARRLIWVGACLILLNSAYLASFSDPSIFFVANVLFHVFGGALFLGLLIWRLWGDPRRGLFSLLLLMGGL